MDSPENWLLCDRLLPLVAELRAKPDEAEGLWTRIEEAITEAEADEVIELMVPVLDRELDAFASIVTGWDKGTTPLVDWDKAVLKRAVNAVKRRIKLSRLEDESSSSRNPLSRGEESTILGVRPPERYDTIIWDRLIKRGRLRDGGHGLVELVPG